VFHAGISVLRSQENRKNVMDADSSKEKKKQQKKKIGGGTGIKRVE